MRQIAQDTSKTWQDYEQKNDGFDKVEELLTRLKDLVNTYSNSVNVGRNYVTGSFFQTAGDFITAYQAMTDFDNQYSDTASKAWSNLQADYKADVKRIQAAAKAAAEKAKKKAQQDGIFGLITDVLQVVAGAALMVAGGILTPFSGGLSLGLVGLGGMLVVGGINSGINHTSMIISGKGYNLIGNLSNGIGKVYDNTLGNVLGKSGVGGFVNGFLSGAGSVVSGMGQFSLYDTGQAINTLATSAQARAQVGSSVSNWFHQLTSGNTYVAGETTAVVASLFVGGGDLASAATVARASDAESILSKGAIFMKTLGGSTVENAKNLFSLPGRALDNVGSKLTDLRTALGDGGLNYAFAGAGDSRSIFSMAGKTVDELPKTEVQMNFNKVTSETSRSVEKAQQDLQSALDKAPKIEVKNGLNQDQLFKNIESTDPKVTPRPDPSTYLSKEYVAAHKALFDDGAIKVQKFSPSDSFNGGTIGNPDDKVAFVMPKNIGEKVVNASGGDPRKLENLLGLHSGDLGDNPAIINIDHPQNVQIPSGNEGSAFKGFWKPGGYTSPGNIPEAVINEVPKGEYTWHSLN